MRERGPAVLHQRHHRRVRHRAWCRGCGWCWFWFVREFRAIINTQTTMTTFGPPPFSPKPPSITHPSRSSPAAAANAPPSWRGPGPRRRRGSRARAAPPRALARTRGWRKAPGDFWGLGGFVGVGVLFGCVGVGCWEVRLLADGWGGATLRPPAPPPHPKTYHTIYTTQLHWIKSCL